MRRKQRDVNGCLWNVAPSCLATTRVHHQNTLSLPAFLATDFVVPSPQQQHTRRSCPRTLHCYAVLCAARKGKKGEHSLLFIIHWERSTNNSNEEEEEEDAGCPLSLSARHFTLFPDTKHIPIFCSCIVIIILATR